VQNKARTRQQGGGRGVNEWGMAGGCSSPSTGRGGGGGREAGLVAACEISAAMLLAPS